MLAIFDRYDDAARELLRSLETAGIAVTPLVIHYDGELPDGALNPFTTYTGTPRTGAPLFFDEVPVPAWCEIRQGRDAFGEILRDGYLIGRINYEPNSFRQVESVDWLLPGGGIGQTDRYDRYGTHYATTYHSEGAPYQTVYHGPRAWQIEVDHVAKAVTLRSPRRLLTFDTLTDFVSHFIDDQQLADDRVLIDSLSYPLFVTRVRARARASAPNATLFWQEPMPGAVPENMANELEDPLALERIVFRDERLLRKVAAQFPGTPVELAYLSPLGQFAERNDFETKRVFTLTNSDELPGLIELLEAFPGVTFSVAALTLMSERLHELGRSHPNLVLTPSITRTRIFDELARASVYLDINAGAHVLDVVKAAYFLNLVVLAHAPRAKAPDHALTFATIDELAAQLDAVVASADGRDAALDALHRKRGPISTGDDYRRLLGGT